MSEDEAVASDEPRGPRYLFSFSFFFFFLLLLFPFLFYILFLLLFLSLLLFPYLFFFFLFSPLFLLFSSMVEQDMAKHYKAHLSI